VTSTLVPLPEPVTVADTVMAAWPLPLASAPLACTTILRAASSRSVISAVPVNRSLTGPIRMATCPSYVSAPRLPVSSAPGRHAATRGMSPKNSHTCSGATATSNSLVISIGTRSPRTRGGTRRSRNSGRRRRA
jgi:hypothetical protein